MKNVPGAVRALAGGAALSLVLASVGAVSPAVVVAQEVDSSQSATDLIARVREVAQAVSAKTEEVKALEVELEAAQEELGRLEFDAQGAADHARVAQEDRDRQQKTVDGIALTRYRGTAINPVALSLSASDPAQAVERLGYMGALSRDARKNLDNLSAIAAAARGAQANADSARQFAAAKHQELTDRKAALDAEREALLGQQEDIQRQVDALDPAQRAAWESQFGASATFDLAALTDLAAAGQGGAAAQQALTRIGSPYNWGATGPNEFDCSGLMYWAYQQQGKTIPRTSQAQLAGGVRVPLDQLQPGDIIGYYPGVTHVGMYVGNGQVVHASTYGVPVQVVPLHSMPVQGATRY